MGKPLRLIGHKFGRLLVIGDAPSTGKGRRWECRCDCGKIAVCSTGNLRSGNSRSCGCATAAATVQRSTKHGHAKRGKKTAIYLLWRGVVDRCHTPSSKYYRRYGGRGIMVSKSWRKFENFYADMGDRPKGLTLERKENSKGYSKANCVWATRKEQQNNTRSNRKIKFKGEVLNLCQWAERTGMLGCTIARRIKLGWSVKDALTKPVAIQRNNHDNSSRLTRDNKARSAHRN
jgi:hypothetical protein